MGCVGSRRVSVGRDQIERAPHFAGSFDALCSCRPDKNAADIIKDRPGIADHTTSLPGKFIQMARRNPDKEVFAYKERRSIGYKFLTMSEYLDSTRAAAKAFIELGLERHRSVLILAQSCPQWNIAYYAAIFSGGVGGGISVTSTSEEFEAFYSMIQPQILIVQDCEQADKVLRYKQLLPYLKAIVQLEGSPKCSDILTSTGEDTKLLRHDAINVNVNKVHRTIGCRENDRLLCILPHNLVDAFQMYNVVTPICCHPYLVYFTGKSTPNLPRTFLEVRPTLLVTTSHVAESIAEHIKQEYIDSAGDSVYQWALTVAQDRYDCDASRKPFNEICEVVARHLVFNKVKAAVGLDELRMCLVLDNFVTDDVKKWWLAGDLTISQISST